MPEKNSPRRQRMRQDRYANPQVLGYQHVESEIAGWMEKNSYLDDAYCSRPIKRWTQVKELLPRPFISTNPQFTELYQWTCAQAFRHWREAGDRRLFASSFLDTMFNDCTFMWDSAFMTMFGKYFEPHMPAIHTLDNFYASQHPSGFICREIDWHNAKDMWQECDLDATGPNILSWAEWEYFLVNGDRSRVAKVFPSLMAYHLWFQNHRRWPDGTYWGTGYASGMDNQTRVPDSRQQHRFYSWCDINCQMALDAKILSQMAGLLGDKKSVGALRAEHAELSRKTRALMWDSRRRFYFDRAPNGKLSNVMSVAAYWSLLSGIATKAQAQALAKHLVDKRKFARLHPIPTQAYGSEGYDSETGRYWRGGVWSPTNYMVLRGLSEYGYEELAFTIALKHLQAVLQVWQETGTIWENYSPDRLTKGHTKCPDFVGWTGLSPIAIFIEFVLGIRVNFVKGVVDWKINLNQEHGIERLAFGPKDCIDLRFVNGRILAKASCALVLSVTLKGKRRRFQLIRNKVVEFKL